MLAPLDNEVIFKRVFSDREIFTQFIQDICGITVQVSKIETEKRFTPKVGTIDFALDIYAETDDHRCIIEIQRIDYDYNFDRFLHYFLMVIAEQQRSAQDYRLKQDVLAIVVLTRPYKIDQRNHEPIKESVMTLDFNPRNLKDELIKIWGHKFVWLNAYPKYASEACTPMYQDWLNLLRVSMSEGKNTEQLNMSNKAIAKAVHLIEYDNIDPATLETMKIQEGKKIVLKMTRDEGIAEGIQKGKVEGRVEGKIEGKQEMALRAFEEGLSPELIKKLTGFTDEQIDALRRDRDIRDNNGR